MTTLPKQMDHVKRLTDLAARYPKDNVAAALYEIAAQLALQNAIMYLKEPRCPVCSSKKLSCENGCTWEITK